MKNSGLYKSTETTVAGENTAKKYMAGSNGSCKGLIGETDNETSSNGDFQKNCSSTILIEVRETPFAEKSYEETKFSSDSDDSIKDNCDLNKAERNFVYTDVTGPARPDLQYDKQSKITEVPEPTMKAKIDNERYNAKYVCEQTDFTNCNINRQRENSSAPLFYSRNDRRWTRIFSCKPRCILYFFIACCISILFASFISYLSYRE